MHANLQDLYFATMVALSNTVDLAQHTEMVWAAVGHIVHLGVDLEENGNNNNFSRLFSTHAALLSIRGMQ